MLVSLLIVSTIRFCQQERFHWSQTMTTTDETCENCDYHGLVEFINKKGHYLLRCPECDLFQKGVLESVTVYENDYHKHYAKRLGSKTVTALVRLGAASRYVPTNGRSLDVGCSIGATVRASQQMGWQASGVDISQAAVDFCRDGGLDCHKVDGAALPFEDESFDLVTNWHVIEHVPNVAETLAEWKRVLKPGGVLMIETPASNFLKVKIMGTKYAKFWPPDHLYTFNRRNLAGILDKSGFGILPSRLTGGLTRLEPKITAYALAYRSYRQTCRSLNLCKSFEIICRKPAAKTRQAA